MRSIIRAIEDWKLNILGTVFVFYIAIFLRGFLEVFTNSSNQGFFTGFTDMFFHYPLWYGVIFLSTMIILKVFTGEQLRNITCAVAAGSFVIVVAPIIDALISNGPAAYNYIAGTYNELVYHFATFMTHTHAISIGMKLEIAISLVVIFAYTYFKTKSHLRAIGATLFSYIVIFVMLSTPVFIYSLTHIGSDARPASLSTVREYFTETLTEEIPQQKHSIVAETLIVPVANDPRHGEIAPSLAVASITFILNVLLLIVLCLISIPKQTYQAIKNMRGTRILHYFFLITFGLAMGQTVSGTPMHGLLYCLSIGLLFLAFLFAWLHAVWENDAVDTSIDRVSNPNRPLAQKIFSIEAWTDWKYLFLLLALLAGLLAGYLPFLFVSCFLLLYHIYSCPPLRLKRIIGLSSAIIAANAMLAVLAGFFMTAGTENVASLPGQYIWGIGIIFFLVENVKNIKDVEGDAREGIRTLPVLLGPLWAKPVIGSLVFVAALLAPIFFGLSTVTITTGTVFGIILFLLINKRDYQERYVMVAYLTYALVLFFEIMYIV